MTQNITSEDVSAWMQQQLAKAHERNQYATISVEIGQWKGTTTEARFKVWHSSDLQSGSKATIEECFDEIAGITPAVAAAKKRAEAAKLMEEADKLEQEGNI